MNENINNSTSNKIDNNIENAYVMSQRMYEHSELIKLLSEGSIAEKQIAALEFDYVKTQDDAAALIKNLTGCDGKIREAVAHKIYYLIKNQPDSKSIFAECSVEDWAKATIDINANICRSIIDSAKELIDNESFSKAYAQNIVQYTEEALNELDKFIYRDKKYTINKQLFKLYWCLEALAYFYKFVPDTVMESILNRSSVQEEYTIREKVAQIIVKTDKYSKLKSRLSDDENYYVRQILHHPSFFQ